MTDTITLRDLGPDDLDVLLSVPEGLFDNEIRADQAHAFLTDTKHLLTLAFAGDLAIGMVSGTVLLHPDKAPALFVNEVGVRESHQRRGIATLLTTHILSRARALGCEGVWLATETDNEPALGLYRSLKGQELPAVCFGWDDAF